MDKSENPKRRGQSIILQAAFCGGIIGAGLTIAVVMAANLGFDKYSAASDFLFDLFMYLAIPTIKICEVLGIPQGQAWLWIMQIVLNALIFALFGSFIGWLIQKSKAKS